MFDTLFINGGGIFSIAQLGALSVLEKRKVIGDIKSIIGLSSGSVLASLLALNCSVQEMEEIILSFPWLELTEKNWFKRIWNLFWYYGMDTNKQKERAMKSIIYKASGSTNLTFLEAYKRSGKEVIICVGNYVSGKPEYWSWKTHPNTPLWYAMNCSTAYPGVFAPIDDYVDIGVMNLYPVLGSGKCLSLSFKEKNKHKPTTPLNLFGFFYKIASIFQRSIHHHSKNIYKQSPGCYIMDIHVNDTGKQFNIENNEGVMERYLQYHQDGVDSAEKYLNTIDNIN